MNFINSYTQDQPRQYYYAEEFIENGDPVIFSVGELNDIPLITKVDADGNIIWEQVYEFGDKESYLLGLSFKKIVGFTEGGFGGGGDTGSAEEGGGIGIGGDGGKDVAKYVLYATNGTQYWLVGIRTDGTVVWSRLVSWEDTSILFYLDSSKTASEFYIVISSPEAGWGSGSDLLPSGTAPVIAKFNLSCSLLLCKQITIGHSTMVVNAVRAHVDGITLAGHSAGASNGIIVDFTTALAVNNAFNISSPGLALHDVLIPAQDQFIISGYLTNETSLFLVYCNGSSLGTIFYLPDTVGQVSKLAAGDKEIVYYLKDNGDNGIIFKFASGDMMWEKEIQLESEEHYNGIHFINYNASTANLTFNAFNPTLKSLLIHTDQDLTSCKTVTIDLPDLSLIFGTSDALFYGLENYRFGLEAVSIVTDNTEMLKTELCPSGIGIDIDPNASLQSPNFYLQAAGSTGADSTEGVHLRWIFAGALGNKHLPKANYASTIYNFNKPNDFVSLFRAPYVQAAITLDLSHLPYLVDDANKVWLYKVGTKTFYIYFRNLAKYTVVRLSYDPLVNPAGFIIAYGPELIEVENKKELFFAAQFSASNADASSSIKTETVSVAENTLAASRTISSRKNYASNELTNIRLVCENGRSIRYKPSHCNVLLIRFEFYSDFIIATNSNLAWQPLGDYALTLEDNTAFTRLEPVPGMVDGKWQRFNDDDFVNVANYQDKWNGTREIWDRNIKSVVQHYITLSDALANPRALESVSMGGIDPDDTIELSNLDLLNLAGYDFHIARMLGLGTMDTNSLVMSGQFVYIAKYTTLGDLEDGEGPRTVNHLSMSIPCSVSKQRLPVPVNLKSIVPGVFSGNESPDPVALTDVDGYTYDHRSRYVTLYSEDLPVDEMNKPFYFTNRNFSLADITYPVYAGLEYKRNLDVAWQKPELPNDPRYLNKVNIGQTPHYETIPLSVPEGQNPLYVHKQKISGLHHYSSYGINWFSRAASSDLTLTIETTIQPLNLLKPPSNIAALLIRKESPLLLTSVEEQNRFNAIAGNADHTLIRLSYDYHSFHELLDYIVPLGADANDPNVIPADNTEVFADSVDIFFRKNIPENTSGKMLSVTDHPSIPILSIIETGDYVQSSTGDILHPDISLASVNNYIGGMLIFGDQQFIIHEIELPFGTMVGPQFTVFKKEISNGIVTNEIPSPGAQNLQSPEIIPDGLFMAVENMQNVISWGTPNPLALHPQIGNSWAVHRETITIVNDDGSTEDHLQKSRGIWDTANVEAINEPVDLPGGGVGSEHRGLYKLTFQNVVLAQHPQFNSAASSVEWYQGIVRIHTSVDANGERKLLKVIKIENIATANKLVVYAYDYTFSSDIDYAHVQMGITSVNFYPGYKVYLYTDGASLTYPNILPATGEGVHYSIFGLRSHDTDADFYSRLSTPQLMFAQEEIEALQPELPEGPLYATRPDFFGRATFTFTTKYAHQPHAVLFYRSNNDALLNALYSTATVAAIKENLKLLGGNDEEFMVNRWHNFIEVTTLGTLSDFTSYPPAPDPLTYKFPNPDKQALFDWANEILGKLGLPLIVAAPGTLTAGNALIKEFVKGAVFNAFVPLTEVPVMYQYIRGGSYHPILKKQTIKDRDGNFLAPGSPDFDMAPMMKITGNTGSETSFTDFTLDGTSNNIYFYAVKELNTQMKMSEFSPVLGPIKLINTNPPEAPQVKRIMPVLENTILGIPASIQLEINAYPEIQNVKKVNIYRAFNALDAQSVRSMKLVKEVDLETENIINDEVWQVQDKFEDLTETPYADGLFYRLVAARQVEYADKDDNVLIKYAPSLPSKLVATLIVEANNPAAPVLTYTWLASIHIGELDDVTLLWDKTAYKAKYHVYKMNNSGNWVKIHELQTNADHIELPLADTDLGTGVIQTLDSDGNNIYSHFKVVAENTSGMLSIEENILTIPS
jgi:hypothetical protein